MNERHTKVREGASVIPGPSVIPLKKGIHFGTVQMDSRFRGNDRKSTGMTERARE